MRIHRQKDYIFAVENRIKEKSKMIVKVKCPRCNADLEVDDSRDFFFCAYCGIRLEKVSKPPVAQKTNNVIDKNKIHHKSSYRLISSYVVLDLETTGLDVENDCITEIAVIKVVDNNVVDTFSTLVYTNKSLTPFITELTGINNSMLDKAPRIENVLPKVYNFIGDSVVIGHNVSFDLDMLDAAYLRCNIQPPSSTFIDTMRLARTLFKDMDRYRLSDLLEYLNIPRSNAHRALGDVQSTLACYRKICQYCETHMSPYEIFYGQPDAKKITATTTSINSNSPLYGKTVVFTGELEHFGREEAMQIVANNGGVNANSVTRKTDLLILGYFDCSSLVKDEKSTKQKTAEEYILKGNRITILNEDSFYDMISIDKSKLNAEASNLLRSLNDFQLEFLKNVYSIIKSSEFNESRLRINKNVKHGLYISNFYCITLLNIVRGRYYIQVYSNDIMYINKSRFELVPTENELQCFLTSPSDILLLKDFILNRYNQSKLSSENYKLFQGKDSYHKDYKEYLEQTVSLYDILHG